MTTWDTTKLAELMEEHIPFNKHLGMRLVSTDDDGVRIRIPFVETLIGDPTRPALHGGVTSALIDTAGGAATFLCLEPHERCSTVDLRVDYLRPGPLADIEAHASVIRKGNRVALTHVDVYRADDEERVIFATGRGVYNIHDTRR